MKQLLGQNEIRDAIERLAAQLRAQYGQRPLTIVGILTGSLVMLADLIRRLDMPLRMTVIQARASRGKPTGRAALVVDDKLLATVAGQDVLVVDDIFDTGRTLVDALSHLAEHRPASVRTAVLLRKIGRSEVAITPDYVMFDIPDEFVVGYGLDYDDRYRNLPYVAALDDSDLSNTD